MRSEIAMNDWTEVVETESGPVGRRIVDKQNVIRTIP